MRTRLMTLLMLLPLPAVAGGGSASSLQWQQKNILALVFKTINHNASFC